MIIKYNKKTGDFIVRGTMVNPKGDIALAKFKTQKDAEEFIWHEIHKVRALEEMERKHLVALAKGGKTRVHSVEEDKRIITILVDKNPKKQGSKSHKRFAMYQTGMTVAAFVKAGGTTGDVVWDTLHKFISVA
jgi:hypothetical protein